MQSVSFTDCGFLQEEILKWRTFTTIQTRFPGIGKSKQHSYMLYYYFFPLFLLLWIPLKYPGLIKYTLIQGSLPYHRELSVMYGKILLDIFSWSLWTNLQSYLQWPWIILLPVQQLTCWINLFWFLKYDLGPQKPKRDHARGGRGNGNRNILENLYGREVWWLNPILSLF